MRGATSLPDVTTRRASRARVVALVVGRAERARIDGAAGMEFDVSFVQTVDEARHALTSVAPTVLIAEPRDLSGTPSFPFLRELHAHRPGLPIIGYCALSRDDSQDIVSLASAGVHELLFQRTTDTPFFILQTLRSAVRLGAAASIAERVRASVPRDIAMIVDACLRHPREATSVATVARTLGVHRKTLVNYCTRAAAPAPGFVIGWCRLLVAAQLLCDHAGSVEAIANALEFPSATALRNMLKRYTGLRPRDVRDSAGFDGMVEMFRKALRIGSHAGETKRSA